MIRRIVSRGFEIPATASDSVESYATTTEHSRGDSKTRDASKREQPPFSTDSPVTGGDERHSRADMQQDSGNSTRPEQKSAASKGKSKSLSTTKLIASAAAAITASIITTKLAGYLNSFLIVGCSSVMIAIFSEVYSRTLKKMRKVSAKVVYELPYEKVLPVSAASSLDRSLERAMEDTTTMAAISSDDAGSAATAGAPAGEDGSAGAASARKTNTEQDGSDVGEPASLRELQAEKGYVRGLLCWIAAEVQSFSWLTKAMIVVLGVTLLSTGVNWVMVKAMEQPSVTNVTQQITKEEVQQLPESEKRAIEQAAVDAAQQKANELSKKIDSVSASVAALDGRLGKLENTSPGSSKQTDSGTQQPQDAASQSDVDALKQKVAALQSELDSLKEATGSGTGPIAGSQGSQQSQSNDQ